MRGRRALLALLALISMLAVACGGGAADDTESAADDAGSEAAEEVSEATTDESEAASEGEAASGDITISGSSTVEPISALNAELFNEDNPDVAISVEGPGTGDGFELFCNGETDISDASRPIEEEEITACEENGVEFIELQVAIDGITMLTNPANEAVTCLDTAAIYALVGPESEGFTQWTEANALATELGSAYATLPEAPLDITAPGQESGTYDSFIELTFEDLAEERGQEPVTRPDYNASADDNTIIQGITGSESSFGWVGYSFFEANSDAVKAIEFAGEDGTCVAPTAETIADGSYALARPLYIYVSAESADRPEVAAFVDYYLSEDGLLSVEETGYVNAPEDVIATTQETWESRTTGSTASEA